MRNLFVYHPGSGTLISLSDPVYLVDANIAGEDAMDYMSNGGCLADFEHKGLRLDNYNMTNLFFGGK